MHFRRLVVVLELDAAFLGAARHVRGAVDAVFVFGPAVLADRGFFGARVVGCA
jgi:hypothetical protein